MKTINIAILGIGTVGGGTYDILTKNRAMILETQGVDIFVAKVLDKSKDIVVARGVDAQCAAASLDEILADDTISIVVETMGGINPAKDFILRSLKAGKSVVTANKELLAKHFAELQDAASSTGAQLYYEASCAGGIPIIRVLKEGMQANNISQIIGIINGTTNYIMTKMSEEGLPYATVLKEAQSLGFAEADPTADVEGFDAQYKLSILSSLAFHQKVDYTKIYREGISKITADDIVSAKKFGYTIKLLGIGKMNNGKLEARVHPCFVPLSHPLASVRNEFNAVFLKGDSVDDIMLYGRGAGALPTGSAICSDIIVAAKTFAASKKLPRAKKAKMKDASLLSDFESAYYLSLTVKDQAGVLAKISKVFGDNKVSIRQMIQTAEKDGLARLVFLTHKTGESAMQKALAATKKLAEVESAESLIRVL